MRGLLLIAVSVLFLACGQKHQVESVADQAIVRLTSDAAISSLGINFEKITSKTYKVNSKDIDKIKATGKLVYSEPNYIWRIVQEEEAESKFDNLWGLVNKQNPGVDISATKAWEITKGSKSIKIAIIDTGVDYNHADLKDNMYVNDVELNGKSGVDDDNNGYIDDVHGYNFVADNGDPLDDHSHGTHVAGTIGAKHASNKAAGVMDDVSIVALKFLDADGSGTTAAAIKAIDYAVKAKVNIMSNSWGGGGYSLALEEAITRAKDAGIVFIAAAGNSGTNNDENSQYPAGYNLSNIISVAAHDKSEKLARFSCYGKTSVHIAAPGVDILSTIINNDYDTFSGTSMATPHVSGIVGLLLSKESNLTPEQVVQRVMETSVKVPKWSDKLISGGRIDAYKVLTNTREE